MNRKKLWIKLNLICKATTRFFSHESYVSRHTTIGWFHPVLEKRTLVPRQLVQVFTTWLALLKLIALVKQGIIFCSVSLRRLEDLTWQAFLCFPPCSQKCSRVCPSNGDHYKKVFRSDK